MSNIDRKLRADPRNSFIAALAFSDLTLCVFTSPLTLWYTLEGHWPAAIDFGQGWRKREHSTSVSTGVDFEMLATGSLTQPFL